jgi:small subunit ribosomal protein S6
MRIYEELFIVRPDLPEEETDQLIERLTTLIAGQGGNVDKVDKWGVRKLAYRVQKRTEGFYVLLQFITVRIDEKLKKIAKRKKSRDKRAARKPAAQVATPSAPSMEHAMAGAAEPTPRPGAPMPGAPTPVEKE